jgi:hypothetical protein
VSLRLLLSFDEGDVEQVAAPDVVAFVMVILADGNQVDDAARIRAPVGR